MTVIAARARWRHLLLNAGVFGVCYQLGNALAQARAGVPSVAFAFESQMPFLPWMIIPYLSSGLLFVLSFSLVRDPNRLRILSQRVLLATVLASLVFFLYPLQFSGARPVVDNPVWAFLFELLSTVDRPYNQLPSLHVAFCIIFWQSLQERASTPWARALLAGWLLLTALATLTTYQHHVLDVVGGALLGLLCLKAIGGDRTQPKVGFYYAVGALLVYLIGVLALQTHGWYYLVVSLLLVAIAYGRQDRKFLNKRQGRFSFLTWLLYAPYLIGYWFTWRAVAWRERRHPVIHRLTDNLWIGRRLSNKEAMQLPPDCTVVDLSNELSATPALLGHRYLHFPLLDLLTPEPYIRKKIIKAIAEEHRASRHVYLHCSMGYSRSRLLAADYLNTLKS